jgi:hypothetical protein
MSALIIGASGPSVLRIVSAFEGKRIITLRADDVTSGCEKIAVNMPHVVLVLVPTDPTEREAIADRATAVGALVVHVDPQVDANALQEILDDTVTATLQRKLLRDEAERKARASAEPATDEVDEGWDG